MLQVKCTPAPPRIQSPSRTESPTGYTGYIVIHPQTYRAALLSTVYRLVYSIIPEAPAVYHGSKQALVIPVQFHGNRPNVPVTEAPVMPPDKAEYTRLEAAEFLGITANQFDYLREKQGIKPVRIEQVKDNCIRYHYSATDLGKLALYVKKGH